MQHSFLRGGAAVLAVASTALSLCLVGTGAHAAGAKDSDRDGMPNRFELANGLNPHNAKDARLDKDRDGLTNRKEYRLKTNLRSGDTDHDMLRDGVEVKVEHTNPRKIDTDGDSLLDGPEVRGNTNPLNRDTDDDGVSDDQDLYNLFGTITSYDSTTHLLTVTRGDGRVVSGVVTDSTRIKFEDGDDDGSDDNGGDDDGTGDDDGLDDSTDDRVRARGGSDGNVADLTVDAEVIELRFIEGTNKLERVVLAQ